MCAAELLIRKGSSVTQQLAPGVKLLIRHILSLVGDCIINLHLNWP